jgi:hypothetical protein
MMLQHAAETHDLAAVVSEGAGARSIKEDMQQDDPAWQKYTLGAVLSGVKTASIAVFSNQLPPPDLNRLVPKIAPTPLFLIAAPNSPNGERLSRSYYRSAGQPKALWEIPESKHTGGIEARPAEYERRVVGFFDKALAR